jgi:hypothetical protein
MFSGNIMILPYNIVRTFSHYQSPSLAMHFIAELSNVTRVFTSLDVSRSSGFSRRRSRRGITEKIQRLIRSSELESAGGDDI